VATTIPPVNQTCNEEKENEIDDEGGERVGYYHLDGSDVVVLG
jgi:hypothetical protein